MLRENIIYYMYLSLNQNSEKYINIKMAYYENVCKFAISC